MLDVYATRENIGRRPRKNGDEYDAFGNGRHHLASLVNHHTGLRNTKTRATRRDRRAVAQVLRTDAR